MVGNQPKNILYKYLFLTQILSNDQLIVQKYFVKSFDVTLQKNYDVMKNVGYINLAVYFAYNIDLEKLLDNRQFVIKCIMLSSVGEKIMEHKFITQDFCVNFSVDSQSSNEYVIIELSSRIIDYKVTCLKK